MISTERITLNSRVVQEDGNIVSDMDGEKVMLSIETGNYYNLGEIGGVIWDLIKNPIEVGELIEKLLKIYQIEKEECEQSVLSFIEQLNKAGLIHIN